MKATQAILDHLSALTDPVRCRVLLLLEEHELTVGELCSVLQLPQSTVSRHLKTLGEAGWVVSRRDGTSHYYSLPDSVEGSALPQLWSIVRDEIAETERKLRVGKVHRGTLRLIETEVFRVGHDSDDAP